MKQIILIAISFCFFNHLYAWQGTGTTEDDPIQITSKADMEALADSVNNGNYWSQGKYFKLMNDIAEPITTRIGFGTNNVDRIRFHGSFNGNGKNIIVSINMPTTNEVGVFGGIGTSAVIENLNVYGEVIGQKHTAGIVGYNIGTIKKCNNYASVTSEYGYRGGIAGTTDTYNGGKGIVLFCNNYGTIYGGPDAGSNCCIGGIVGHHGGYISNCLNAGNVSGYATVGGIIGHNTEGGHTSYSTNIGSVISYALNSNSQESSEVGGIAGMSDEGYIGYCINSGLVIGNYKLGGICGTSYDIIENCINTGVVICRINNNFAGGIVGSVTHFITGNIYEGIISNCYYDNQMCIYNGFGDGNDEIGQAEGCLTKELIGTNLQAILGNTNWIYNENLYPMLKGLEDEIISKIAASPAYLDVANTTDYDQHNNLRKCFYVNLENNVEWTKAFDKIEYSDDGKVYLEDFGTDTMYAGIGSIRKTIPIIVNNLCKKVIHPSGDIKFRIIASEHKLVSPNRRNYRVPIYIEASEDISGAIIEKMVVHFDNIFYPHNVLNNNGNLTRNYVDTIFEAVIENIKVPDLKAGDTTILLNIRGDVLLGNKDSADIVVKEVKFAMDLEEEPELIDGYITIEICEEGGSRFLGFGNSPSVKINNNPAIEKLEVECKVLEKGKYTLEIVDILGKSELVKEWYVDAKDEKEFEFTIPLIMYGNGNYFLILNTPTEKYTEKFVIWR